MIYLICALQAEASPFVKMLNMKKMNEYTHMDVYEREEFMLVVTGSGSMKSAMCVTELMTRSQAGQGDFVVNIGICGYAGDKDVTYGQTFLCNKIKDQIWERDYYPDVIYRHPFMEADVTTCLKPVTDKNDICTELVDMEAAGVYQSALRFLKTNQVAFIKIVSDKCNGAFPSVGDVHKYIDESAVTIIEWCRGVHNHLKGMMEKTLTMEEQEKIQQLGEMLGCSATMMSRLRQQFLYEKLTGVVILEKIDSVISDNNLIEKKSKKDGKVIFEQLIS